MGLVGDMRSRG